MSAVPKCLWSISNEMRILYFPSYGSGYSFSVPPYISSSLSLVSGRGWEVWPVKCHQNLENHTNKYSSDDTLMFKIKVFPPYFSRTYTDKAKSIMVKKHVMLLQYLWILNQVGPGGKKSCNKSAQTAKSVKNTHDGPARML